METLQVYAEGLQFLINADICSGIFPFQPCSLKNTFSSLVDTHRKKIHMWREVILLKHGTWQWAFISERVQWKQNIAWI